jgi:hypothetical protein
MRGTSRLRREFVWSPWRVRTPRGRSTFSSQVRACGFRKYPLRDVVKLLAERPALRARTPEPGDSVAHTALSSNDLLVAVLVLDLQEVRPRRIASAARRSMMLLELPRFGGG